MSIESSTTPIKLDFGSRVGAFILDAASAPVSQRDFVKFLNIGEDVLVTKVATEAEADGFVRTERLTLPGKLVEISFLYKGSVSGGGGYAGEAFESVSGPDSSGVVTLTRGDATTQTITIEDQDNVVCYKVIDGANPLYKYSMPLGPFTHQGAGGEFKYRTLEVNSVESAEADIHYYNTGSQIFLPANYPLIEASIGAHLTAQSVSFESVQFVVTDNGDGTHNTEVIITSLDNAILSGGIFRVKYNIAFGVFQASAALTGPFDNEEFHKKLTLSAVVSWFKWDGSAYVAEATPDFTGKTVTIDICKGYSIEDAPQTVALVALTPLTVTASLLSDIRGVTIKTSAGEDITSGLKVIYATLTTITIESNSALAGVVVNMRGIG